MAQSKMVRSRRLELPRVAPQRPQRCASTNSATTARGRSRGVANARACVKARFARDRPNPHIFTVMIQSNSPIRFARADGRAVSWAASPGLTPYPQALATMERRVEAILAGEAGELIWLVEHPPLYSAGVSARDQDLLSPGRFPVYQGGRGGRHTYHGPGQRVAYVMLDLRERERDVRALVGALEAWIIDALSRLGVSAGIRPGRVGVWVEDQGEDRKIAAIGLKLRRWVSLHGISLNVAPNLEHFDGIVPCGIREFGVTSLERLGVGSDMEDVDGALKASFEGIFGPLVSAPPPD